MRLLVCGDRDFGDLASLLKQSGSRGGSNHPLWPRREAQYNLVLRELDRWSEANSDVPPPKEGNWMPNGITIINGKARGVDTVSTDWAVVNWCEFKEFPADWTRYGRAAGPIRNKQMLDEGRPDQVMAFLAKGSKGTKNMIEQAQKRGLPVHIICIVK
jgi:hypothetical protein